MKNSRASNQNVSIAEITALLLQLRTGNLTTHLAQDDGDGVLKPIIEEVNALAQHLQEQAQTEKFFSLSLDLLCIAGPDATFKKVNPSFKRVLGYSEHELISQPFLNFIHPEDVAKTLKELEKLTAGETTIYFENRYRAKNGSYRTLAWTSTPDSETGCIYAVARDITAQKKVEIDTKLLSERLHEAELISKIGFWELNLKTYQGKWSKGQLALFGLNSLSDSPTFELFIELVHPEDRVKVQTEFARILEEKLNNFEIEFRILVDQGKKILWMKEYGKLELSDEGKPLRISGSIQDVTQAKLAEIELKEICSTLSSTSQLLERTGTMAKVGGWELDLSTGRVSLSKETQRIHEIDDNYVPPLYSTGSEWYPPESWPIVQAAVQEAIEHGKSYDLETKFISAKGAPFGCGLRRFL